LRPAQGNSSQDPTSKVITAKWTRDVAQEVECLLCRCEALSSNLSSSHLKEEQGEEEEGGEGGEEILEKNRYKGIKIGEQQ
jgi:hypothetical protein